MTPGFVDLHRRGELRRRAARLKELLQPCRLCPRACGAHRLADEPGDCSVGRQAVVARACHHRGEEPPISGDAGAGTIFFAGCNLRCVFCQNHAISRSSQGVGCSSGELAEQMLELQARGCHNIALVTPSHVVPQIVEALDRAAAQGLCLPVVYNTSAYERVEVLRLLEGVVDVYLPDLKYGDAQAAARLADAPDYVSFGRAAVREMARQVGRLQLENGIAHRGLIVRHLVLPGDAAATPAVLAFVGESLGPETTVSLMAQYRPPPELTLDPPLDRSLTAAEYTAATDWLAQCGLDEGWVQELTSVESYVPDFARAEHPFEV